MNDHWKTVRGLIIPGAKSGPAGLTVGFTTIETGDFGQPEAAAALCEHLRATKLRLLHQVHGVDLLPPDAPGEKPEGDGWLGEPEPGTLYAVKSADCLPLLIWHDSLPLVAAVHAGWRGAVAGIAARAVEKFGLPPRELNAALGPSICRSCYEVGIEVAQAAGENRRWLTPGAPGKFQFDVAAYVAADLERAGVQPEKISLTGYCTACRPDIFWSWRGQKTKSRIIGFIGIIP